MVIWDNRGMLHRACNYDPASAATCTARPSTATSPSSDPDAGSHRHRGRVGHRTGYRRAAGRRRERRRIFDLDGESAEAAADKIAASGGRAVGVTVDMTDRPGIDRGVAEVRQRLGRPTILVDSAGLDGFDPFLEITAEKWSRMLGRQPHRDVRLLPGRVPDMVEEGWGRIVNISSSSAHSGQPADGRTTWRPRPGSSASPRRWLWSSAPGITVNTIPPGFIDTPMLADPRPRTARGGRRPPAHHPGASGRDARGYAKACSFLVADEAGYITGQVIGVNGGRNTMPSIPPLPPKEWPPEMKEALAGVRPGPPPTPLPSRGRIGPRRSTRSAPSPGIPS